MTETRTAKIRFLGTNDVDTIVDFGERFYNDGPWPGEYHRPTVRRMVGDLARQGVSVWAHKDGEPIGMLLVMLTPFTFDERVTVATELAFYILPEYRKGGLAAHLLETAEINLRLRQVRSFSMASLEAGTPEAAEKLYSKLGFTKVETVFMKELS